MSAQSQTMVVNRSVKTPMDLTSADVVKAMSWIQMSVRVKVGIYITFALFHNNEAHLFSGTILCPNFVGLCKSNFQFLH